MAKSMSGASRMCNQATLWDSLNATSSPGLAGGVTPYGSPDGRTIVQSGRFRAPVRSSRARLEAARLRLICGPNSGASSLQHALACSLANRWQQRDPGSIDCALTWKPWRTTSGRLFCRLALSVSTMRALGCSLSATPTSTANQACPSMTKWIGCRGVEVTPEAFCWRMGFPTAWLNLPRLETPSCQGSRRN